MPRTAVHPLLQAAAELECRLGAPTDPASELNHARLLADDRSEVFPQDLIALLNALNLQEFYVPRKDFGGRLERMDEMLYVLRALSRRDITLAIAHVKTFLGACPVWIGGSAAIQARCAQLIRQGHAVSLGLTERDHGGDLVGNACMIATADGGQLHLHGEKWLINNATRSAAITVYANLQGAKGAAAGTLAWVEKARLPAGSYRHLPKIRTQGVRAADISGLSFEMSPILESDIVGARGKGLDIVLRGLQLSRTLCCGLSIGAGDLSVRTSALCLMRRHAHAPLYREPCRDEHLLTQAFVHQLVAECASFAASRTIHVRPQGMGVTSSLVKYFVPDLIEKVFDLGDAILGQDALLPSGGFAHHEKAKRDHRLVSLFDGSTVVNLQMMTMNLKRLLERMPSPRDTDASEVRAIFDLDAPVPPLAVDKLTIMGDGRDVVVLEMLRIAECDMASLPMALRHTLAQWRSALIELRQTILSGLHGEGVNQPAYFDSARRYATLYAAAACFHVWHWNKHHPACADAAFSDGRWLVHAIDALVSECPVQPAAISDLLPWLERLVRGQQAISFLRLPTPDDVGMTHVSAKSPSMQRHASEVRA